MESATERNIYIGILREQGRGGIVELDHWGQLSEREIVIRQRDLNGAPYGMKVVVSLIGQPRPSEPIYGRIIEVLGDPGRPDVAILGIMRYHGLVQAFPDDVMDSVEPLGTDPDPVLIGQSIAEGRLDLREQAILTIDGEDAKDLDDAVSIERLPNGAFRLWVHIADVSHYVKRGTPLIGKL